MTHPQFQRRRLFQTLAEQTFERRLAADPDFFAIGFSGDTSTPGFMKMGWERIFDVVTYLKPALFCRLANLRRTPDVRATAVLDAEIENAFMARIANQIFGIWYDVAYLRWKFSNPRKNYTFIVKNDAVAVIHDNHNTLLIDFVFGEDKRALAEIGWQIDLLCLEKGARGIASCSQPGGKMERILKDWMFITNRIGYGPGAKTLPFITYAKSVSSKRLQSPDFWDIHPLDLDSY